MRRFFFPLPLSPPPLTTLAVETPPGGDVSDDNSHVPSVVVETVGHGRDDVATAVLEVRDRDHEGRQRRAPRPRRVLPRHRGGRAPFQVAARRTERGDRRPRRRAVQRGLHETRVG